MAKPLFQLNQKVIIHKNDHYWCGTIQFYYYDPVSGNTIYQVMTNADEAREWVDQAVKGNIYLDTEIFGDISKQIP